MLDQTAIIDATRRWISSMVIGLDFCPFARRVFEGEKIRYVVTDAADEFTLTRILSDELKALAAAPITEVETTLLIHPQVFADFLDYNDFLDAGDRLLRKLRLEGVIQLASFHPAYQFADADAEAVENYTNRSPYPMLHLLREASVTAVAGDEDALLDIPQRNIVTLRTLGKEKVQALLREATEGPS